MSNTHDLPEELRPIRVLFIVDSLYWVIGNFAKQIQKENPCIEASICSKFAIKKAVKRFGHLPNSFDVIHFLTFKPKRFFVGQFPIVTTFHHRNSKTKIAPLHEVDAVMTVSQQWLHYLTKQGIPENYIRLVPFGVNTNQFYPAKNEEKLKIRNRLNIPKETFLIGFAGKRSSDREGRKGLDCFTKGVMELRIQLKNLSILFIGPGWQNLSRTFKEQGISCTYLPYYFDHAQIAKFYRALDVFWVTSRIEGGPVPLLEAMASGIPCISTPVGAALDLINHDKNGFIVSFDSSDLFVNLSLKLAQDPELGKSIGNEARNTILRERQWSQVRRKIQELYSLAIRNYHARLNHSFSQNETSDNGGKTNQNLSLQNPMSEEMFLSNRVQSWIQACEQINGLQMMLEMREWKVSSRFALQALRTTPFDPSLWREIISVLLKSRKSIPPQPMV